MICIKHAHTAAKKLQHIRMTQDIKKTPTLKEVVKPHALDHSNKEHMQDSISLVVGSSTSSEVRLFLSLHKDHITQAGTKFQTSE